MGILHFGKGSMSSSMSVDNNGSGIPLLAADNMNTLQVPQFDGVGSSFSNPSSGFAAGFPGYNNHNHNNNVMMTGPMSPPLTEEALVAKQTETNEQQQQQQQNQQPH